MKERPILFSGPMVRAILAGQKTQTRRLVKPQPLCYGSSQSATITPHPCGSGEFLLERWPKGDSQMQNFGRCSLVPACPYGKPGDRLWVRETHYVQSAGYADGSGKLILYKADGDAPTTWTPSIHMYRWASRITLEITEVRLERLQNISAADAVAEGCDSCTPYDQFRALWTFIHTADGPNGWAANPWVWVVGFRRVDGGN